MRKAADKLKWLSVSITVASLVMVFWVWPAWNSGSQTWYWGNNGDSINTMYRNAYPPPWHSKPFQFEGSATMWFTESFMANEAANRMLTFVYDPNDPWQYHIEWYLTPMMMMETAAPPAMDMVSFMLTIGRYRYSMGMMAFDPFFSIRDSGPLGGSMKDPIRLMGSLMPVGMENLAFMPRDVLGGMLMLMTTAPLTVPVANTCYFTSPLSDPGYPGAVPVVPTLSQWGALILAILLLFLYFLVTRCRVETGRS